MQSVYVYVHVYIIMMHVDVMHAKDHKGFLLWLSHKASCLFGNIEICLLFYSTISNYHPHLYINY